jgi:hypothetical protein
MCLLQKHWNKWAGITTNARTVKPEPAAMRRGVLPAMKNKLNQNILGEKADKGRGEQKNSEGETGRDSLFGFPHKCSLTELTNDLVNSVSIEFCASQHECKYPCIRGWGMIHVIQSGS